MRKVAITFLTVALLMAMFAAAPAIAEPLNQKVSVEVVSTSIKYPALTALLAPTPNPYPAPPVRERYFSPGHILILGDAPATFEYNTMHVRQASAYYTLVLGIGEESYTGISCNVYCAEYNSKTMRNHVRYDAIWYVGALGDISNGFSGNMEASIFDFVPKTGAYSRLTVHGVMQGFGSFEEQTIMISFDSNEDTDGIWRGYCLKG